MKSFLSQLKWQFILLQKNSIISISLAVTIIYGVLLFVFKDTSGVDDLLVAILLNDPAVIGYFFIALAIYTEIKHQILPAIFVTPINLHVFLLTRTIAISILGVVCSFGLALPIKGFNFDILPFVIGSLGICVLSALMGVYMLTFANEFLKFSLMSAPFFMLFVVVPLVQYLNVMDMGFIKYLFPIQGSLDLIDYSISAKGINFLYSYLSILILCPVFYWMAFLRFKSKIVQR